MNKTITVRQFSCFCGFALMAFKFLGLPSLMYVFNSDGGLITALCLLLLDVAMIFLAVALKQKFPDYSLYELISLKLGKIVAKLFYVFLAVLFFCQMIFLINEASSYMHDVVNEEMTNYYILLVLLPVVACIVKNGIKSFARTAEFVFGFVIVGFVICLLLGEGSVSFGHLGPFFEGGAKSFFNSIFSLSFFFSDFLFVYIILDKVETNKKDYKYLYFILAIVCGLLIALYINYFRLYSITAIFHKNAIADVTQYRRVIGNVGNLDIFVILFVFFSLFFQAALIFYSLSEVYKKIFGYDNIYHSIISIIIIIIILEYLVFVSLAKITSFIVVYMRYFSAFIFTVLPLYLLILLIFSKRRKQSANNKKDV